MVDQLRLEQQFGPQPTEFPEDSDTIERALDYRESVREVGGRTEEGIFF